MRYTELLDSKDPTEIDFLIFDYTDILESGETVSSATVSVSDLEKLDATPSTIKSGSPTVSSPLITQTITGGVEGAMYLITCLATLSSGRKIALAGRLPCKTLK